MQTKAQCRVHRDVQLKLFASRVQMGKVIKGGQAPAELIMVVEPCHKCLLDAKIHALRFTFEDMKNQGEANLKKMEEANEST